MTPKLWFSILFLGGLGILAIVIPLTPWDPNAINPQAMPQAPSWGHWFGTDDLGRDLLLRSLYGARISLMVGFVSVGISLLIGVSIGLPSGFIGGIVDAIIMRILDVLMALPYPIFDFNGSSDIGAKHI